MFFLWYWYCDKNRFVDVSGDYNVNLDLVNERFFYFWIVILGVVFIKY